jgi:gliding motility-associated-like protein
MKTIKLLLFLLAVLAFSDTDLYASHITGGDIEYEYVGRDTTFGSNGQVLSISGPKYLVRVRLYRDCTGINIGSAQLYITSSCYANRSISMTKIMGPLSSGNFEPPTYYDCVEPATVKCIELSIFADTIELDGLCADWRFYYSTCCRPPGIDNLQGSVGRGFYFEARLNNAFSENNSSPEFISTPARAFCVGNPFNWKQLVNEADGDSISFELVTARENLAGNAIPYIPPYTFQQPLPTNPPQTFTLDQQTGLMSFTLGAQGTYVIPIRLNEYRFDTINGVWRPIGHVERELIASIAGTCSPIALDSVKLDISYPQYYVDALSGLYTADYVCLDSSVVLKFTVKLDCESISPDGSDFRLTAPDLQPIPIKELYTICDANNETDSIVVKLHKPLSFNGDYFLYSKLGNDGTTLINKCGFPMAEFDTLQLKVQGCFTTQIDMRNVTVVEDEYPRAEWSLDTVGTPSAPFPNYLVDEYKIFRSDDGGANYTQVYTISDYKNMFFNDQSLNWADVDAQSYKYRVEVVVNSTSAGVTRNIHSILLESMTDPNMKNDSIDLFWNSYNGWPGAEYTVELGMLEGSIWTWVDHSNPGSPDNPTLDSVYLMINEGLQPGDYAARVRANYPGGAGPDSAYSNWIRWSVLEPPIPPIVDPIEPEVPNVMTPNNDGNNDLFIIENIETWSSTRNVTIFNRWGNVVFESGSYTNETPWDGTDQSGKQLADGVYFYMVDLSDQPSGKTFQKNGQVTLMGGIN